MAEVLKFLPKTEKEKALPNGTRIFIEHIDPLDTDVAYGDVAEHEAEHAVVAIRNGTPIIEATIIAEGDSLGHVTLTRPDPVATSTSHGRAGSFGDRMLVARMGLVFESLAKTAHSILHGNKRAVQAVAGALTRKKWLSGADVEKIINQVDYGEEIRIRIVTPDGREQVMLKRAHEDVAVSVPLDSEHVVATKENSGEAALIVFTELPTDDVLTEQDLHKAA